MTADLFPARNLQRARTLRDTLRTERDLARRDGDMAWVGVCSARIKVLDTAIAESTSGEIAGWLADLTLRGVVASQTRGEGR